MRAAGRCATAGLALTLVVAGCGKDESSSPTASSAASASATASVAASSQASASSASPAAAPNYATLMMPAASIPLSPAGPFTGDGPKVDPSPPPDVSETFTTADKTAAIVSQVIIGKNAADAATALDIAKQKMGDTVSGAQAPMPSVSPDATVVAGTSPDGSKAVTMLVFTEQNTTVQLIFLSAPGDPNPVPTEYVETVATLQSDTIKHALPNFGG
jgi:hypothetical protein